MKKIDIALSADQNYFLGLTCTILSILKHSKADQFNFYILDGGLNPEAIDILKNKCHSINKNTTLEFLKPDTSIFNNIQSQKKRGNPICAYSRILLPSILPNHDKIIYIDSDFFVGKNLAELYDINMEDNWTMAVQDPRLYLQYDCPLLDELNLDPLEKYFNSGLLFINLDAWRKYDVQGKMIRLLSEHGAKFKTWDQTAFNIVLYKKVHFLPLDWNWNIYTNESNENIINHNIHYFAKIKPWNELPQSIPSFIFHYFLKKVNIEIYSPQMLFRQKVFYKVKALETIYKTSILRFLLSKYWISYFSSIEKLQLELDAKLK